MKDKCKFDASFRETVTSETPEPCWGNEKGMDLRVSPGTVMLAYGLEWLAERRGVCLEHVEIISPKAV